MSQLSSLVSRLSGRKRKERDTAGEHVVSADADAAFLTFPHTGLRKLPDLYDLSHITKDTATHVELVTDTHRTDHINANQVEKPEGLRILSRIKMIVRPLSEVIGSIVKNAGCLVQRSETTKATASSLNITNIELSTFSTGLAGHRTTTHDTHSTTSSQCPSFHTLPPSTVTPNSLYPVVGLPPSTRMHKFPPNKAEFSHIIRQEAAAGRPVTVFVDSPIPNIVKKVTKAESRGELTARKRRQAELKPICTAERMTPEKGCLSWPRMTQSMEERAERKWKDKGSARKARFAEDPVEGTDRDDEDNDVDAIPDAEHVEGIDTSGLVIRVTTKSDGISIESASISTPEGYCMDFLVVDGTTIKAVEEKSKAAAMKEVEMRRTCNLERVTNIPKSSIKSKEKGRGKSKSRSFTHHRVCDRTVMVTRPQFLLPEPTDSVNYMPHVESSGLTFSSSVPSSLTFPSPSAAPSSGNRNKSWLHRQGAIRRIRVEKNKEQGKDEAGQLSTED